MSTRDPIRELVDRYPETSNAVWILVLVTGFLLVVPIAGGAMVLCVFARVNAAVGLVFGMAAWLAVFGGLRQLLLWRREGKVRALLDAFDDRFPADPARGEAIASMKKLLDDDNEVLAACVERLTAPPEPPPGADADPEVDAQVEALLRPLAGRLDALAVASWVVGLGVPGLVLLAAGIAEPKEPTGLFMLFLIVILVWAPVGSFLYGVVQQAVLTPAVAAFDRGFPKGDGRRDKAMASLDRRRRHAEAAASLRGAIDDD